MTPSPDTVVDTDPAFAAAVAFNAATIAVIDARRERMHCSDDLDLYGDQVALDALIVAERDYAQAVTDLAEIRIGYLRALRAETAAGRRLSDGQRLELALLAQLNREHRT